MPKTPEQKVAENLSKVFDSLSLNNRMAASFTIHELTHEQQTKFFDFMLHCIEIFAGDSMEGYVSMDRAQRNLICIAIKEAIENEGYHFLD